MQDLILSYSSITFAGVQPITNGWQNHAVGSARTSEAVPSEASISSLSEASLQASIPDKPAPKGEERRGEFRHAVKDATSLQPVQEDQNSQRDAAREKDPMENFQWVHAPRGTTQPARGGREPPGGGVEPRRGEVEEMPSAPLSTEEVGNKAELLIAAATKESVSSAEPASALSSDAGELLLDS